MVTIPYDINAKDSVAGVRLHNRVRPMFLCLGIFLWVAILLALMAAIKKGQIWDKNTLLLAVVLIYPFGVHFWYLPWRARGGFKRNKFAKLKTVFYADESGVGYSSELTKAKLPWNYLNGWKASKNLILVYPADALEMFFVLPKRLFTPEQWYELINLLQANLKRRD